MTEHKCKICNKKFKSNKSLTSHMNWHNPAYSEKRTNDIKKGSIISANNRKNVKSLIQVKYEENPKSCKLCQTNIPYNKKSNIFCSSSCSTKFNNVKRKRKQKIKIEKIKICHKNDTNLVSNRKKSTIKIIKLILNIDYHPTLQDFETTKSIIETDLHKNNLTPKEINEKYNIKYKSNFGSFITTAFGIKLKNLSEALKNYNIKNGITSSNEKEKYWNDCKFKFNVNSYPKINGFYLTENYGFCCPQDRIEGVDYLHKDHMVSIHYGWNNNIPSYIISHPANCEILMEYDNIKKGLTNSISIKELMEKIKNW